MAYRVRRPSTWIYGAFLLLLAFWVGLANADSVGTAQANAPADVAGLAVILGMIGIVVTAALFGDAAVRDFEAGMDPLLFTSPLRKAEYLGGRFLAALAVNAVVLVAVPVGLATVTLFPSLPPETFGPFRAAVYAHAYLFFLLPNLVLVGAVLFALAMLTRKTVPVYLGAIGLFIAYLLAASLWDRVANPVLSMLADPLGAGALENMTRYWTTAERNTRLVGFPALLVWNRLVWLGLAGAVLALLHARFRFAHHDEAGRRRKERRIPIDPGPERTATSAVPIVAQNFGLRTRVLQTLAVARRSLAETAGSRWFAGVLVVCTGLTVLMGWNVGATVFDTSTWPVTMLVAGTVLSQRLIPILYLLVILYAGELVWKDRDTGVAEIADATPVPEVVLLPGRFLALVASIVMIQAAQMLGGLLIQALQGYRHFEIGLYLRMVFGLDLAGLVVLAALAMTVHVVVNHKYVGHIVALVAFMSTFLLPQLGIVRHHLLLYGTDPGWTYSDMNGFGPFLGPLVWFRLYWAAWALLLGVAASLLVVRGRESGMRRRLRQARARFTGPVAGAAGVACALILLLGGFIFYNTNVLNDYRTPDEAGAPQALYEQRYARFADAPQPVIDDVELREEIWPDEAGSGPRRRVSPREPDRRGDRLGARVRRSGDRGALDIVRPRRRLRSRGRRRRLPHLRPRPPARARRLARARVRRLLPPARLPQRRDPDGRRRQRRVLRPQVAPVHRLSAGVRVVRRRRAATLRTRAAAAHARTRRRRRARASLRRARPGPRARGCDHRHISRPDRGHAGCAARQLDRERAAVLPLRDRPTDLVRQRRVLREVRGARGPLERRRARDLPSPVAHVRPRPDDARHEGVARVLHDAVRSVAGQPAAYRRVPALRRLRPRGPADDRVRRGRVPQPRPRGRGRSAVLRDRARGRAPVVGRHGSGRPGARCGVPVGIARQLQRDDGGREDVRHGGGTAGLRVPDESLPARARAAVARGAAAGGGGPAVHQPTARARSRCTRCASASARIA